MRVEPRRQAEGVREDVDLDGYPGCRKLVAMQQKVTTLDTLPKDLREKVEQEVQAGDFPTPDEAIRQAILTQHERLDLRRSIAEADAAFARGSGLPGDQVFNEIRTRSAKRRQE